MVWRVGCDNAYGRCVESTLVPISVQMDTLPLVRDKAWVEKTLNHVEREVRTVLGHATASWRADATRGVHNLAATRIARERAIVAASAGAHPVTFQPGLFDRRSERSRLLVTASQTAADVDRATRLAAMERDSGIVSESAELLLVLIP